MRKLLLVVAVVLLSGCIYDGYLYPVPGVYGGPGPVMGGGYPPGGPGRMDGGMGGVHGGGFHR